MKRGWVSLRRFTWIVRVLVRHGLATLLAPYAARRRWIVRRFPSAALDAPERLRVLFEDVGGTFIKFGQILALQPDILAIEYCNALFKLLDQVDPFPYREVERTFVEEFGKPPEAIFDSIEREPLATASVGQVHVAYLGGRKVAVKCQRPNVETEFKSDVRLMSAAIRFIKLFHLRPIYWMIEPMSEFVSWTNEELDYRNEARYAEELRRHALDAAAQYVPQVHGALTTPRTLVVEFLEAVTLLDYLRARERGDEVLLRRLQDLGFDRKRFAANVIDNFLGNAFRLGIYHADLHPANLMILERSVVGYIDFGITGVLSPYARQHLMKMTLALAQGDMESLCEEFLLVTVWGEGSDLPAFRQGLDRLAVGWYLEVDGERRLHATFTQIMTEMLHLSRTTDVMPERDIIKYIRSSIAIDGLITRFEPDFNLGRYLAASCARYIKWFARRSRFTTERFLDLSSASGHLWQDGAARGNQLLDRLSQGEMPARLDLGGSAAEQEAGLRARALQLAGAAFGVAVLMVAGPRPEGLGLNLWSAELVFVGAALTMLVGTLRRLGWS